MKIAFYYVDVEYINFLKEKELTRYGYTNVPNVSYSNNNKFFYGVVLLVNNIPYYVPVSSYTKKQEHNLQIKIEHNHSSEIVGTLRFNYMIPVPYEAIRVVDFKDNRFSEKERIKLQKEYKYCLKKIDNIKKLAKKTYDQVMEGKKLQLIGNSCDFKLLEKAYKEYIADVGR